MLLFVYGTLKKGKYNHERFGLDKEEFVKEEIIEGYTLKQAKGTPYPFCVPQEGGQVLGEVYNITDENLIQTLDRMEKGAGYRRETLENDLNVYIFEYPEMLIHLNGFEEFK